MVQLSMHKFMGYHINVLTTWSDNQTGAPPNGRRLAQTVQL